MNKCRQCGALDIPHDNKLCNKCWELTTRIKRDPKRAAEIVHSNTTEDQRIKYGNKIIKILGLRVKKNGRVDTSIGDKTPLGLGSTMMRYFEESLQGVN